jgi:sporulation protein YlmC with PRC-barrel domain
MKKKITYLLSSLVVLAVLLSGCATGGGEGTGTPGATEPGFESTQAPGAPVTEAPTQPQVTESPTEPIVTETVQATETVTSTEALPPTGFVDPGRVSNLLDFDVYNRQDEQVGSVRDMVFNLQEMKIDYLIVDMGGFLGIGGKLVAVPYDQVEVQAATSESAQSSSGSESSNQPQNAIILDVTKDQMDQAPEFNPDMLPGLGEPADNWDADIQSFWASGAATGSAGTETPMATESPQTTEASQSTQSSQINLVELQGVVLASDLIGFDIQGPDGQSVASVQDVIVNPDSGDLQYLVISVSGIEGIDGQLILIPLQAFGLDIQNQIFALKIDPQVLVGAPTFEQGNLPDTTQPDWDADIHAYWQDNLPAQSQQ